MNVASFELLEFLFSPTREKYHVIGLPGSPSEAVTRANYSADKIIVPTIPTNKTPEERMEFIYRAGEKEQLQETNLPELIREHHIEALVPDTYSNTFLEDWAKMNQVHIVCTPFEMQSKYENKIFFERFLQKHGLPVPKAWILESIYDSYHVDRFPVVLQTPGSMGSAGTFVIENWDELNRFTSIDKKVNFPLLCREFVKDAIPIGVSILVGPKNLAFSAIRMQAYFTQPNGKSTYYGIQWMKTSSLHPKAVEKLNKSLLTAGKAMQKDGFRGIAAFDLMVRDEDIFFIECNPRTGGSSPQIAYRTELLHGLNLTEEYISIMTGGELSEHKPFIPDSRYEGFTLDVGFFADIKPAGLPLNSMKTGVYTHASGQLQYLSAKMEDLDRESSVFVHYVRPAGTALSPGNFMGFVFTHFPLLEIKGKQYTFSEEAKKLLQYLEDILIKK